MRSMTTRHASRNFSVVLEAVEQGEEVVLTRDGVPVARLVPEPPNLADRIEEVMARYPVDPGWADELEEVMRELRAETYQERTGPAE